MLRGIRHFLRRKRKNCTDFAIFCVENAKCRTEFSVSARKKRNAVRNLGFSTRKMRNAPRSLVFSARKKEILRGIWHFPRGKSEIAARNSQFPRGKSEILRRILDFLRRKGEIPIRLSNLEFSGSKVPLRMRFNPLPDFRKFEGGTVICRSAQIFRHRNQIPRPAFAAGALQGETANRTSGGQQRFRFFQTKNAKSRVAFGILRSRAYVSSPQR